MTKLLYAMFAESRFKRKAFVATRLPMVCAAWKPSAVILTISYFSTSKCLECEARRSVASYGRIRLIQT